ncbi:AAA family ATPase [Vulcanisaeta sp. JCM 16161]|uniref:ATP-binding protein n=1 Tax=Vulcanisaeta sp. JCM 16161 TaxID=1295372 RepID=UPI0006D06974|nr:ATP-binding protein [Vulcanisaeta sp. JCM 16161]
MINVADINALIQWIQSQQLILGFPNITVNFKDRHNEITNLLNDLRIGGVRIIYGPLGAGKTTLLNLLAKSLRAVGVGDTAVIYVNYESRVTNIIMPGALSISGLVNDLLNRLSATIMGVTVGVGQVIELAKALWNYIRELHGVNNVLIIHDDLDRWFMSGGVGRGAVQELITMYAGEFEGKPLGEAPWGDKYVKVFISISDQSAVELAWRYRGKGGLMTMLLWNLPRDAFLDVVHDVKRQLMSNVDIEHSLLWQLLGGNVRALMDLATNYNWDLGTWLKGIINHVRNLMYREALILNLPDVSALIAGLGLR